MWATSRSRNGLSTLRESFRAGRGRLEARQASMTSLRQCQRCLISSTVRDHCRPRIPSMVMVSRIPARLSSTASQVYAEPITSCEEAHAKLLQSARAKVGEFRKASEEASEEQTVEQQKARVKILKELSSLGHAWESYENLRNAIIETRAHLDDPDPTLREMLQAEHEGLIAEFDNLIENILPRLILPPLPDAGLPVMMTLTAGIGGGESARFAEEVSRMYTRYAEIRGWKVEVLSAVEGPMAKGSGGNGYREMTIKFVPNEWAEEGAPCFGDLMWERGVHRVQRVPPGATVDKLQSSTINLTVSPIYPDTPDEPLLDPKDVKEEVMRAGGSGGQHVNRTESAVRLTHVPTGISVSMQDSRSQHQNRAWAWDVLRAKLSEKKRQDEQEAKNASRLNQIKGAGRGDRVRTYNFPQDRVTDHRIGYSANGLEEILSGDGFERVVDALKKDLADRRLENLLQGEEDLLE